MGQGGNMAVESAAVLANQLVKMLKDSDENGPTVAEIEKRLKKYFSIRQRRANMIVQMSNELTRMEALSSPKWKFRLFYLAPRLLEMVAGMITRTSIWIKVSY
jgi:2-polyprenyl-6-methoxyphenol hydroxylase-like FAD-dependent oxidoreductase